MIPQQRWAPGSRHDGLPFLPTQFLSAQSGSLGGWYILYVCLLTVPVTLYRIRHPNGWLPGDWLINYSSGFVRRGLPGEAMLLLSHLLRICPLVLGVLLPFALATLLYATTWRLYRAADGGFWALVALLSPGMLAFPLLDPVGALRKDLLVLLALAVLLRLLLRDRVRAWQISTYLTAACVLVLLSHEGMLPYLVYLFAAVAMAGRRLATALRTLAAPVVATAGCMAAVTTHRGSAALESGICRSIQPAPALVCSGSIAYLSHDLAFAHADVVRDLHAYHYLFFYPLLTVLAVVPLIALARVLYRHAFARRDLGIVFVAALLAALASLPLFVLAMDWGRWIYLHLFCAFLLLLFVAARERREGRPLRSEVPVIAQRHPRLALALLLVYLTCWNIPHYGNYPKKGYLNLPLHVLKQRLEQRKSLPHRSAA